MIQTYTVTLHSKDLTEPLVMDVPASSPERAVTRARVTAMHLYHHAPLLRAFCTVSDPAPLED